MYKASSNNLKVKCVNVKMYSPVLDYPSAFFEHSHTSTIPFCTEDEEIRMSESLSFIFLQQA